MQNINKSICLDLVSEIFFEIYDKKKVTQNKENIYLNINLNIDLYILKN